MTELKKDNPQRTLSKSLLIHALLDLMEEVPYQEINVTDLAKKADLARRTFYRHFTTIDEVLDFTLIQISEQFLTFQKQYKPTTLKQIAYTFFCYWQKHISFLHLLKKNNLLYRLHDKFPLVQSSDNNRKQSNELDTAIIEYAVNFTSGAMWSLLVKWLENGAVQSPEEMSIMVECILLHLSERNF